MKVITVLGTRPEIIRLSRVMAALDQHVDHVVVHTGQNYDYELNQVFFDELEVRKPDYFLQVDTSSLGRVYGEVLIKIEPILAAEEPDVMLVLGDTNSAIAAIIAKRMHIPIIHMEAGNRSFDWRVPEETNRHIVDSIADINMVYTEHARRNLLSEGVPPNRIYLSGSPMAEVLDFYGAKIGASPVLDQLGLTEGNYYVASLHREENVDDLATLTDLLGGLSELASVNRCPVVVSLHPRTRRRLAEFGFDESDWPDLWLRPPFGFFDYVKLQRHARCVLSDSGTLSEEAAILGFPAVQPRRSMERPEGIDAGALSLPGTRAADVLDAVTFAESQSGLSVTVPTEYRIKDCSRRVLAVVFSTALH